MTRKEKTKLLTRSIEIGVSFSVKTCSDYSINWQQCLQSLLDAGIKRFRIMSYWDLHTPTPDTVDFTLLDEQIRMIEQSGGSYSLCIGMRQPRWPETHVPQWALDLDIPARVSKYSEYHQMVIERYKDRSGLLCWQLENEFWNRSFGQNNTFSRARLKKEFKAIRNLSNDIPIVMSLGNTVGLPIFAPRPDAYGTTLYLSQFEKGRYTETKYKPIYFKLRRLLIKLLTNRELVIHELQAEPWGPKANWEMDEAEQSKSMNPEKLKNSLSFARKTGIKFMDLWGGEWWYWRKTKFADAALWSTVQYIATESRHK